MDTWTDEHAALVSAAAPTGPGVELDAVWARVARAVAEDPGPTRRPRRSLRAAVGAGVAATVLGLSGVAAADLLSARTGHGPVDAEDLRLGGPGEKLDPSVADFRQVLEEETADIPFPSATAWQVSIDEHVRDLQEGADPDYPTRVSTGALRAWTAVHAICSWSNEWVVTGRTGDAAAHEEAARMLVDARHWSAITDLDPVQRASTQFAYLRLVARAVEGDDVAGLASVLADHAFCIGPSLVPDFRQALPDGFRGR